MDDELLWRAVVERRRDADGTFVYAVRSTGVYCRPSCPSRRPRRAVVEFFPAPPAAEQAGFRPCRRCRPGDPAAPDPGAERIRRACAYIAAHAGVRVSLARLARVSGSSPYHLQRTFKQALGLSPREYAEACRLGRFRAALRNGAGVTRALYDAGYGSSSRVYERARARLGMTPAVYGRGGKGMSIDYLVADSPLGRLLVAATVHGVCAVKLGDSDAALEADLRAEYAQAAIRRGGAPLARHVRAIVDYLRGRPALDLPLDVRATAFQWAVWQKLRAIPYGTTRTYREVARLLGQPTAARAVARACATNPVALVVPCHRVVREGGGLGGYRWGLARKRALLAAEAEGSRRGRKPNR